MYIYIYIYIYIPIYTHMHTYIYALYIDFSSTTSKTSQPQSCPSISVRFLNTINIRSLRNEQ